MKQHSFEVRRKINHETCLLYALFFVATLMLLGIVHLLLAKINLIDSIENLTFITNDRLNYDSAINLSISGSLLAFILICFLYKYINTRQGDLIAKQLGATEVTHNHSNPYYNIFNQSIIEMSITANIPPPRAFVLFNDNSINAFAAGTTSKDAVIAITQGALESLTPSELKALVAHEVSHIASGDTRMNRKITAVIFGFMALTSLAYILFRLGFQVTQASRNNSRKNNTIAFVIAFFIAAAVTYLLSLVLEIFGKVIQSCLSRKREYYADSQAVVSMRQTLPIYHLLLKLQTASVTARNNRHPQTFKDKLSKKFDKGSAPEYQHFYFNHQSLTGLFATHPPLEKRIQSITKMMSPQDLALLQQKDIEPTLYEKFGQTLSDSIVAPTQTNQIFVQGPKLQTQAEIQARIPKAFIKDLNNHERFPLLIYACLLSDNNMVRDHQLKLLPHTSEAELTSIIHYINNNDIEYKSVLYRLLYSKFNALPLAQKELILTKAKAITEIGQTTLTTFGIMYTLNRLTKGAPIKKCTTNFSENIMPPFIFLVAFILQKASNHSRMESENSFHTLMTQIDPTANERMPVIENDWEIQFEDAIDQLNLHTQAERQQIMTQLKDIVLQDQSITQKEYELLQLLGFCLNIPISVSLEING